MVENVVGVGMKKNLDVCQKGFVVSVCIVLFGAEMWLFSIIPLYWVIERDFLCLYLGWCVFAMKFRWVLTVFFFLETKITPYTSVIVRETYF